MRPPHAALDRLFHRLTASVEEFQQRIGILLRCPRGVLSASESRGRGSLSVAGALGDKLHQVKCDLVSIILLFPFFLGCYFVCHIFRLV